MMHEEPVLALTFSRDSELIASGSQDGNIKVWRVRTGQCVRRFAKAHTQGVTAISFSRDSAQVASGSFDTVGKVHGLKSGKALKELRGHASYINDITFSPDSSQIASGSSDGTVRIWDAKTCDCIHQFRPPQPSASELSVNSIAYMPNNSDHIVICNRSPNIYIMTATGNLVQTLSSGKKTKGDFVQCCVSAQGGWIHGVAEDSHMYSFEVKDGKLQNLLKVHEKDVIGLTMHPHRNLMATWGNDSTLKLWHAGDN